MDHIVYQISPATQCTYTNSNTLVTANGADERAFAFANFVSEQENCIERILLLQYTCTETSCFQELFPKAKIECVKITNDQREFIRNLLNLADFLSSQEVVIDISCIHILEIFALIKYFKVSNTKNILNVAYSIPFDYKFFSEPFLSYRSYYGNLKTQDIIGFTGTSYEAAHTQLLLFLGFEGSLSSKVTEDIQYGNLVLINNMPSFFIKYKDFSTINNYDLLSSRHNMLFVSADNPFETYNLLSRILMDDEEACVAPLGTKTVALGVCLYALEHSNLRVVYPISNDYEQCNTNNVLQSLVYRITFES